MAADAKDSQVLWHYTVVERLQRILQVGEIRPPSAGGPRHAKPAIWFSSNPVWEPTANRLWRDDIDGRMVRLSKDQTYVLGGGLARIGVARDVAPHDWKAYRHTSGISADDAKRIYDEAVSSGARPASGSPRSTPCRGPSGCPSRFGTTSNGPPRRYPER